MNDYSTPPSTTAHSRLSVAEKGLPTETIRAQRRPEAGGPQPLHHIGWAMELHRQGGLAPVLGCESGDHEEVLLQKLSREQRNNSINNPLGSQWSLRE